MHHQRASSPFLNALSTPAHSQSARPPLPSGHTATVSHDIGWLQNLHRWPGLETVGKVEAVREIEGRIQTETRYYIMSQKMSPEELLKAVRNHWAIENSLHWVLDVQMGEDDLRNRAGHGAENLAVVRRIALNIIRLMDDKLSIRRRLRWAAQKPEYRLEFICRAAELAPELSNAIAQKYRSADRPQKDHDRPQTNA